MDLAAEDGPADPVDRDRRVPAGRVGDNDAGLLGGCVEGGQSLERVDHAGLRWGDAHRVPGQRAIPVEQPPRPVRLVIPDRVVGIIVGDVPERHGRVDLGVLEHRQPLDHLARVGQVVPVRVLVDVDGQRGDAVLLLQGPVGGVGRPVGPQRTRAQFMPAHDVGQDVVGLRVGQEVGREARVIVRLVRPDDQCVRVD